MILPYKVVIAAISGLCCFAVYDIPSGKMPGSNPGFQLLIFCALVGVPFSAGVLFPYLRREKWSILRAIALVFVSGFSFVFAIAVIAPFWGDVWDQVREKRLLVSGSLVGAAIVLTGARYLIPLKNLSALLIVGLIAAIPGGLIFAALQHGQLYMAFMVWHVLMAISIHVAETRLWFVR